MTPGGGNLDLHAGTAVPLTMTATGPGTIAEGIRFHLSDAFGSDDTTVVWVRIVGAGPEDTNDYRLTITGHVVD